MTPKFDPTKPFEEYNPESSAPVFDPSQPFEEVENSSFAPSTDTALETGQDFLTGASQGATLGAADEIGGGIAAGIETLLGKAGIGPAAVDEQLAQQGFTGDVGESFLDKYRGYQQAGEQASDLARERSPYAEFGGQIGGSFLAGAGLGLNKAALSGPKTLFSETVKNQGMGKAALDLLRGTATSGSRIADVGAKGAGMFAAAVPALAVESAMTSKSDIVGPEADLAGVAGDVGLGLGLGLPAMVGLNVAADAPGILKDRVSERIQPIATKVSEAFADEGNPRLRQMAKSYQKYGRELGIHPRSHGQDIAGQKFALNDQKAATQVLDVVNAADSKLGQEVGQSIEKATARGAMVDVDSNIQAATQRIMKLTDTIPGLGESRKSALAMDQILMGKPQVTPTELKNIIDDLDAAIGTFKAATNKDAAAVATLKELTNYRKSISDSFKKAIPEYGEAAQRFESFRNVLEQLVSGDRPADVTDVFYGNLRNQDQKVYDRLISLVENVQRPAQSSQSSRNAFTNFMDALEKFEADELTRGKQKVLPSAESMRKFILNASDDSVLRSSVRSTTESRSVVPDLREALIGKAPTSGAYLAGRISKNVENIAKKPVIQGTLGMAKAVYNAPAQSVANLASKLETSGQFKSLGKALRESLENGDSAKKNAALFTIMQNPNAKAFISADDFPDSFESEEEP